MRRPSHSRRGYALLTVLLLLAVISAAVATTMQESAETIRSASIARSKEMVSSGLEHGLHLGITQLQQFDAGFASDPRNDWDIFDPTQSIPASLGRDFIGPLYYPPAGPQAEKFIVRVGLRPSQRARAPAGEDVRFAYGEVVELQVGVENNTARAGSQPVEERVSVGVLIPRRSSHAN